MNLIQLRYILSLTLGLIVHSLSGQIYISEVVSKSSESLIVNGTAPDWIELHNPSDQEINLTGYFLSDDLDESDKWVFPNVSILADGYLVIIADGTDLVDSYIHTNFKISSGGEDLILSDITRNIIDQIDVPNLETDISYGRIGTDWFLLVPTPGSANIFNQAQDLETPVFNNPTGIYQTGMTIEVMSPDPQAVIEYYINNLKGKIELGTNTASIAIDTSTIICARAVKSGAVSSEFVCQSYIIDRQHEIPILSIIIDQEGLYDPIDGLFQLGPDAESNWPFWGANFWSDGDEEVYFQYFNEKGQEVFNAHADFEMHGGRESRTNPQKTFRLLAKEKYNQPFFEKAFFNTKPNIASFKRIVVRNASGDFNAGHCRDGFLQDYLLKNNLDLDANGYQPVAVYINGAYYGMMAIREKMDRFYTLSNYGTTEVDLLEEQAALIEGDLERFNQNYDFIRTNSLKDPLLFSQAEKEFDLSNLTDYFLSQICNNSTAWPQNNIKFWKGKEPGSKWRYLLFDMDISLGRWPWTFAEENSLQSKMTTFQDTNVFINILQEFLEHEDYRNYFLNRHQDLYNTDFSTDSMLIAFEQFVDTISNEINHHLERWPTITFDRWENIEQEKIRTFMRERPDISTTYFNDFFNLGGTYSLTVTSNDPTYGTIDLNSLKKIKIDFTGTYFQNIPITATAQPITGKYFDHWEILENGNTTNVGFNTLRRTFKNDARITAVYKDLISDQFVEHIYFDQSQKSLLIKVISETSEPIILSFYDRSGKFISQQKLSTIIPGENYITYSIDSLMSGIYVVQINQQENNYSHKFFYLD